MACIRAFRMVVIVYHNNCYRKEIQAMKKNITVVADLLSEFPRYDFQNAVNEFQGDYKVRAMNCQDLFKTLLYGNIIEAFSVREIESSLMANETRLYHCDMKKIKRSTLCDAMEKRDHRIFERAFLSLVEKAKLISGQCGRRFKNPLKIVDATTIDLCLERFSWATFRKTKGAIKLHVAIDGDHLFPEQVYITNGDVHEVRVLSNMCFGPDEIVVLDRGYLDYNRLRDIALRKSWFVTRLKSSSDFKIVKTISKSSSEPVRGDYRIELKGQKTYARYPDQLRMVVYHDDEYDRNYRFLTNNMELPAQDIADIYKARWQVELFFKWIKQNLKIKTFWGTSPNAVRIQIWIALILFLLLWIKKVRTGLKESLQRILQILKTTLFTRSLIEDLFKPPALHCTKHEEFWLFEDLAHA
jgi:hypothetical protein